jgi:hypothetical protein
MELPRHNHATPPEGESILIFIAETIQRRTNCNPIHAYIYQGAETGFTLIRLAKRRKSS